MKRISVEGLFHECEYCTRIMIPKDLEGHGSPFAHGVLDKQMKDNNWVFQGPAIPGTDHEDYACEDCTKTGKITFICAICKQVRTSDLLHEDMYREPDCTVCHETMTAKAWDKWHDEQSERNRWYYSS